MLKSALAVFALAASVLAGAAHAQTGPSDKLKTAIFAGGCFWCVEEVFDKVEGVVETTSGYTGGIQPNPTYEQVSTNTTGHAGAVRVKYDPARVTFAQLLEAFWHNVDPFDAGGQFCDRGSSYRSAIFVMDDEEEKLAKDSKEKVAAQFKREIATEIVRATPFYLAEGYHQDYYTKNPLRYTFYKWNCGRAQRLEEIWGKKQASGAQ